MIQNPISFGVHVWRQPAAARYSATLETYLFWRIPSYTLIRGLNGRVAVREETDA